MKKIISVIIVVFIALSLSACSTVYTDTEKFAARANFTINRNIWDYLPNAVDYSFTTIEYFEENGAKVIRANCTIRTDSEYPKCVFIMSDNSNYLIGFLEEIKSDYEIKNDSVTGLSYVNLWDYSFTPNVDNYVDKQKVNELAQKYIETKDKSYIGME